jgi:hypothetical protein
MVAKSPAIPNGIHEGLTYEQYDAIEAVRRTLLVKGRKTMRHFRHEELHPDDSESDAYLFGQAIHAAILEPDRFEETVVLGPINPRTQEPYGRTTKTCKEFAAANPGLIVLGKGDRERIAGMGAAIRETKRIYALVRSIQRSELTLVWNDEATGVRCKTRIDGFVGNGMGMLDLKSTTSADPDAFSDTLYTLGYHIQAAMSVDAWRTLTGEEQPFNLIPMEKESPYLPALYTVGPETLAMARQQYRETLHKIAAARESGVYPGYPDEAVQIDVREWVFKRFHAGE